MTVAVLNLAELIQIQYCRTGEEKNKVLSNILHEYI